MVTVLIKAIVRTHERVQDNSNFDSRQVHPTGGLLNDEFDYNRGIIALIISYCAQKLINQALYGYLFSNGWVITCSY